MKSIKPITCSAAIIALLIFSGPAYAVEPTQQTFFNNITDFFASMGHSSTEKARIKQDRKNARRSYRMRKQQQKKLINTQKRIKKQQKNVLKKRNAINQSRYHKKKK